MQSVVTIEGIGRKNQFFKLYISILGRMAGHGIQICLDHTEIQTIQDDELRAIARDFKVDLREDFLD